MKFATVFVLTAALATIVAVSSPAWATSVALVPDTLKVTPGSPVTVSVNMIGSPGFTMTAISAVILYDPAVFTYVDPSVVQGAFLKDNWDPWGGAGTPGELRVGAIDWNKFSEYLAAGDGTLFKFTLLAKADAPLGSSELTWGYADGLSGVPEVVGFDYGDAGFQDVVLPSSGASINVYVAGSEPQVGESSVPEPLTMAGLFLGLAGVGGYIRKRRMA